MLRLESELMMMMGKEKKRKEKKRKEKKRKAVVAEWGKRTHPDLLFLFLFLFLFVFVFGLVWFGMVWVGLFV